MSRRINARTKRNVAVKRRNTKRRNTMRKVAKRNRNVNRKNYRNYGGADRRADRRADRSGADRRYMMPGPGRAMTPREGRAAAMPPEQGYAARAAGEAAAAARATGINESVDTNMKDNLASMSIPDLLLRLGSEPESLKMELIQMIMNKEA